VFVGLQNTKMSLAYKTCEGKQNPLGLAIERICLVRIRLVISLIGTSSAMQKIKGER